MCGAQIPAETAATSGRYQGSPVAHRADINAGVDATLSRLYGSDSLAKFRYANNAGLMAGVSLQGTKISKVRS